MHKAQSLGVSGYARNLADGRVEVLACGEPAAVEEFTRWLWQGSAASKVQAVETSDCDPAEAGQVDGFVSA